MEVPKITKRSMISPHITFPIPGKVEGAPREYISLKLLNGYKNQSFTTDDCPDNLCGYYIHNDEDPGNGSLHPSYLTVLTNKTLVMYGRCGWRNVSQELDHIVKKLLSSDGFAEVRAATVGDVENANVPMGKFLLASSTITFDWTKTRCSIKYVDNGNIRSTELLCSTTDSMVETTSKLDSAGILAVVTLDTIIKDDSFDEDPRESSPWLWK